MSDFFEDDLPVDLSNIPIKDFKVSICERRQIRDFIEKWHYSKNINGLMSDYCFKLTYKNELVGAMIYGQVAMAGVWKKYVENPNELIELRRLCCIDDTPKNTESYFIGYTLRWLRKNTALRKVISYSDLEYGHSGGIYKACNFELLGQTSPGRVIMYNGRRYHDKTIRTKYKDGLKPFAQTIKTALTSGDAYYKLTKEKNIYMFSLG